MKSATDILALLMIGLEPKISNFPGDGRLSGGVESRHAAGEKSDEGPVPNEAVNHHRSHGPARTKDSCCADATQEIRDVTGGGRTRIGLQPRAEYRSGERGLVCIPRSRSRSSARSAQPCPSCKGTGIIRIPMRHMHVRTDRCPMCYPEDYAR